MKKIIASCGLSLVLAACGSSGGNTPTAQPEVPPSEPPVVLEVGKQVDLAIAKAENLTDIAEPEAIDAVTVTSNEDGEPKAL